ncbi:nuclear membrane protein [Schizosaccharomyces japonicus yFS275]|uniref:Nuclear fusion protein tht1 n=1 Tax=Schizosaccharomyces japonicus (strain yFS275 / FY16936) TaxID=402676 RepID=B6JWN2_SCHJY|nr:nuclear membrane protein [Schizosaccharomyces japonicus yFS275]EEB05783.1 nuclear membrane protein [Schizosaccharomyces japonicus yFS275]
MQYWLMIAFVCLLLQADGCFASSLKAQLSVAPKAEGLMEFDSIIQVFQTLSRKPTCHQSVIYSLMAQCELQNSVLSMDERIQFSTRLTMCDLEHADITVPSECLRGSQQKCLATLEDNSAWWLAFVSYYRDMDRLCKSAFLEYEKQNALELNKNITRIQKRLLEVLQEKLTEQEISLELMQDTTATSVKRLEQIITSSQSSVIMDMEQQTAQLQKLQNSFDLLTQYQSEVLDSEAFASNKLELLRENVNGLLSAYSSQMNALANIANRGLQSLADEVSKHQTNLQESAVQDAKIFANEVVHTYRNSMAQTKNDLMNFMKSQQSLTEFYFGTTCRME